MIEPSLHTEKAVKNPTPKNAMVGDYFENPEGYHRKYIVAIDGEYATIQDAWVQWAKIRTGYYNGSPIYSSDITKIVGWEEPFYHNNISKLSNLRRWGMHGNR